MVETEARFMAMWSVVGSGRLYLFALLRNGVGKWNLIFSVLNIQISIWYYFSKIHTLKVRKVKALKNLVLFLLSIKNQERAASSSSPPTSTN
jgi:hypothetical protein